MVGSLDSVGMTVVGSDSIDVVDGASVVAGTADVAGSLDGTVAGAAPPNASTHQIPVSSG